METTIALLRALRPSMGVFAGLLAIASFRVSGLPVDSVAALAVVAEFLITCATMAHNDYCDRINDVRKGKLFAFEHPQLFLRYVVALWTICFALTILVLREDQGFALLLVAQIVVGLFYQKTMKVFVVNNLFVAVTAASPALFAVYGGNSFYSWILFFLATINIFSREILKDIHDQNSDRGYKATIPLRVGGLNAARIVIIVQLFIGCALYFVFIGHSPYVFWPMTAITAWAHFMLLGKGPRKYIIDLRILVDMLLITSF